MTSPEFESEVPLAESYRTQFSAAVRRRGEGILDDVTVVSPVKAGPPYRCLVIGGEPYAVEIDPGGGSFCSCPGFRRSMACKHMWAAMLVLDRAIAEWGREASRSSKRRRAKSGAASAKTVVWDGSRLAQVLTKRRDRRVGRVDLLGHVRGELHFFLSSASRTESVTNGLFVGFRTRRADGRWSAASSLGDSARFAPQISHDELLLLSRVGAYSDPYDGPDGPVFLPEGIAVDVLTELVQADRLFVTDREGLVGINESNTQRVTSDPGAELCVTAGLEQRDDDAVALDLRMQLDGADVERERIRATVGTDHVVVDARLMRWAGGLSPEVFADLAVRGAMVVPGEHQAALRELIEDVEVAVAPTPVPILWLRESVLEKSSRVLLRGELGFRYGDEELLATMSEASITIDGLSYRRDEAAETAAVEEFTARGGVLHVEFDEPIASLPAKTALAVVPELIDAGFEVYAANERVRSMKTPSFSVSSGVDWFEVGVKAETSDGRAVAVPALLEALRKGASGFVRVGVGEVALVAGDGAGLDGLAAIRRLGKKVGNKLRFPRAQAFLLDALLSSRQAEVSVDAGFAAVRRKARAGLRAKPAREPKGFAAELRPYQREGLGWFRFLAELGIGGCLADDMGLGKTVQVLALLEKQRRRRPKPGPSLVVAPKSLVFHWEREAARFAPKMRVLPFVGTGRFEAHGDSFDQGFADQDLVLTTYGTLRNDIDRWEELEWHYVVLDESQAIKNERSQASKAVRLCRAQHRLALSGTPIENHLGELWSLFEFLNPGMLGGSKAFRELVQSSSAGTKPRSGPEAPEVDDSVTAAVRDAVRPFLLRRTKEQVLTDLPGKTEQVLDCEMSAAQRRGYEELAKHYRARLLGEIDEEAVPEEMRFQVLEALLRLRQAACHPGLLDPARAEEDCAKFDALLPMLDELRASGNKALVFSQFPSFLRLLRPRLEARGMAHAYLDGSTTKREEQVDRFQNDPDCGLFLISIKAGGHGLNLTAANYVFVLDPWWNPAVEAQAVDRAYRIGQTRSVSAYRMICRGTVEERVAELQQRKRSLVSSVLGDDRSVLQELTAADVAALLA